MTLSKEVLDIYVKFLYLRKMKVTRMSAGMERHVPAREGEIPTAALVSV